MIKRSSEYRDEIKRKRTVRDVSPENIPDEVLENCLEAVASAPNGANKQPWTYVVVKNPEVKALIREKAEEIERGFYGGKAGQGWLDDLEHLGTNWKKPFLTEAPVLIVAFAQTYGLREDGVKEKHYYVSESVGLANGFLVSALHNAGLASLTYTPAPMRFLNDLLDRPLNERPVMVIVTGYPHPDAEVPDITKKDLTEYSIFL